MNYNKPKELTDFAIQSLRAQRALQTKLIKLVDEAIKLVNDTQTKRL